MRPKRNSASSWMALAAAEASLQTRRRGAKKNAGPAVGPAPSHSFAVGRPLLDVNAGDADPEVLLSVADVLVVTLAAAVLDDVDLLALHRADHVGGDGGVGDGRGADLRVAFPADEEDP